VTQNISEKLNDLADTKIRIVGAIWNEDKKEWDYDQLFYSESPSEIARLNRTLQVSSSDTGYVNKKLISRISNPMLIKSNAFPSRPYQTMHI